MGDPLDLDSRRRLFEIVRNSPGVHFRELQRLAKMPTGTFEYNLSQLVKSGAVEEHADGGYVRYYPSLQFSPADKAMLSSMRQEIPRGVVLWLIQHPRSMHKDILSAFSFTAPTLTYHLKRLVSSGVLLAEKEGSRTVYLVQNSERVVSLLIAYRRTFADKLVDAVISAYVARQ
jgi:predicted transcriptional regulator